MIAELERENTRLRELILVADWLVMDTLGQFPALERGGCRGRMRNKALDLIRSEIRVANSKLLEVVRSVLDE